MWARSLTPGSDSHLTGAQYGPCPLRVLIPAQAERERERDAGRGGGRVDTRQQALRPAGPAPCGLSSAEVVVTTSASTSPGQPQCHTGPVASMASLSVRLMTVMMVTRWSQWWWCDDSDGRDGLFCSEESEDRGWLATIISGLASQAAVHAASGQRPESRPGCTGITPTSLSPRLCSLCSKTLCRWLWWSHWGQNTHYWQIWIANINRG